LSAIQVLGKNILAAGQGITLWDAKSKTAIKTFTGHPNYITQMECISLDYFASMCNSERHLRIW